MAWFNPNPVQFNPSSEILKSASAIGDTLQNLYKQNYQEAQDTMKTNQWEQSFGLQKNTNDMAQSKYDTELADKLKKETAQTQMGTALKDAYLANPNQFKEVSPVYAPMLGSNVDPQYLASLAPEVDKSITANSKLNNAYEIATLKNEALKNKYDTQASNQAFLNEFKNVQLAQKDAEIKLKQTQYDKTAAEKQSEFERKQAELENNNNVKSVQGMVDVLTGKSAGEKANILGKDFPEDQIPLVIQDLVKHGKIGTISTEDNPDAGWFGSKTINKYVPYEAQSKQATVKSPYSDGTVLKGKDGKTYKVINGQPVAQ